VYVAGRRRRELVVVSWESLPAPKFGRASLMLRRPQQPGRPGLIEDLGLLPAIGERVLVRPAAGSGGGELRGIVTSHSTWIDDEGEHLAAEAEHELGVLLAERIDSRRQLSDSGTVEVPHAAVRYNDGEATLASASPVDIGGRYARVFDSSPSAIRWSVADALAYLLATAAPQEAAVPGLEELRALGGEVDLATVDVSGMPLAEALVKVAARGGIELRSSREGLGLVAYRPGRDGRRAAVCLQPAGRRLCTAASNLWKGRIVVRRRPSRRGVLALGERKRYESTFELKAGWDTSLETSRWRDFVRSESPQWAAVSKVYRKWVLNEHGGYSGSPWQHEVHDFSAVSAADFALKVPRRFLPCLSADSAGNSLGVVVEYRLESPDDWRRWPNGVWVARDECAVILGGDALPGEFLAAAAAGTLEVRVTAVVEADARLAAQIPGDAGVPREIVDFADQAAWRQVHATSIFHGNDDLGSPGERDDTQRLERLAAGYADAAANATEAELTLAWIDTSFNVGDIIERINGRALELSGSPGRRPSVRSVRHDFTPAQTTTLIVSG
jgi:hypothetical protein